MTIVGFTFDKILVEKKAPLRGRVDINNNVAVKSIEGANLPFGKEKQDALKFTYEYTSTYHPDIGQISLTGSLIYMDEPKKVKEVLQGWEKGKNLPAEIMKEVMDNVLNRCNIQALVLSRDVNLPSPIPLPKVTIQTVPPQSPPQPQQSAKTSSAQSKKEKDK